MGGDSRIHQGLGGSTLADGARPSGLLDRFTVVMSRLSQALAIEEQDYSDETYGQLIPVPPQ